MQPITGYVDTPFSLGIEGEEWSAELPGLVIPTKALTMEGSPYHIAVVQGVDGFGIVTQSEWHHTDSLLMAASIVRSIIGGVDDG